MKNYFLNNAKEPALFKSSFFQRNIKKMTNYLVWWTGFLEDGLVIGVEQVLPDATELWWQAVILQVCTGYSQMVQLG